MARPIVPYSSRKMSNVIATGNLYCTWHQLEDKNDHISYKPEKCRVTRPDCGMCLPHLARMELEWIGPNGPTFSEAISHETSLFLGFRSFLGRWSPNHHFLPFRWSWNGQILPIESHEVYQCNSPFHPQKVEISLWPRDRTEPATHSPNFGRLRGWDIVRAIGFDEAATARLRRLKNHLEGKPLNLFSNLFAWGRSPYPLVN